MSEEEIPFNDQYNDLVTYTTLSKRGQWWTALLLVNPKTSQSDDEVNDSKIKSQDSSKRKVIIRRWRKHKQQEQEGHYWQKSKDFTISSKKQWLLMREIVDKWVNDENWG